MLPSPLDWLASLLLSLSGELIPPDLLGRLVVEAEAEVIPETCAATLEWPPLPLLAARLQRGGKDSIGQGDWV